MTQPNRKSRDVHASVLQSLSKSVTALPRVYLDNARDEANDPVVQPGSPEIPKLCQNTRYQIQGEIARGGMGAILKGRDTDLGRSLALKVLLDAHKDSEMAVKRFIEEAQIGGQLQHPGIAPVYELGRFEDNRPFFTMKLVNGETLAWLLSSRRSADAERAKLLGMLHQVCQTMAYAHSRRVIHRDLKPANIMVGSFGEVQVMDWGLAKVLPKEGATPERAESSDGKTQSIIQTVRTPGEAASASLGSVGSGTGSETQMGSAMGTPAYMPPEQALGDVDLMDRRADVFGLGAILCEVLTGEPPYVADQSRDLLRMAAQARLDPCFERLDACGADEQLVQLTKECLSPEAVDRPADAGVLAERIGSHLQSVEDRFHQAKIESAEQTARFEEERKRLRVALALAASILFMICVGGTVWMNLLRQRNERMAAERQQFDAAVDDVNLHLGLAENQTLAVQDAELALATISARQAVQLAEHGTLDSDSFDRAQSLLALVNTQASEVRRLIDQQTKDQQLVDRLELIRLSQSDRDDRNQVAATETIFANELAIEEYAATFRAAGLDFKSLGVDAVAERIRTSAIRENLISTLDHWARSLPSQRAGVTKTDQDLRDKLLAIADAADESPWRRSLRAVLATIDMAALSRLANRKLSSESSPPLLAWLGAALRNANDLETAIELLTTAQQRHPSDFWISYELGKALGSQHNHDDAIGYFRAALATRPKNVAAQWVLMTALDDAGHAGESAELVDEILSNTSLDAESYTTLGHSLFIRGKWQQAEQALQRAVERAPENAPALTIRGMVRYRLGEWHKALEDLQLSRKHDDEDLDSLVFLAMTHWQLGDQAKASEWLRRASEREASTRLSRTEQAYLDEARQLIR